MDEIRPPQEVFEEEVHLLEDGIRQERQHILSGLDYKQISSALDSVVRYSSSLKALQINYEAAVEKQETAYQQSLQSHLEGLAGDIVDTLGISLVERVLQSVKVVPQLSPVLAQHTHSSSALSADRCCIVSDAPS